MPVSETPTCRSRGQSDRSCLERHEGCCHARRYTRVVWVVYNKQVGTGSSCGVRRKFLNQIYHCCQKREIVFGFIRLVSLLRDFRVLRNSPYPSPPHGLKIAHVPEIAHGGNSTFGQSRPCISACRARRTVEWPLSVVAKPTKWI